MATYLPAITARTPAELAALKWPKPPDWVFNVIKPTPLTPHLQGLTQCALYLIHIAAIGVYAKATEGCFNQTLNRSMVDAIFAEQFDWRYYKRFGMDLDRLKLPEWRWRVSIAYTFNHRMGEGRQMFHSAFITASAQYVVELTRHVLRDSDRPAFDRWLAAILDRLHAVAACPAPTNPKFTGDMATFAAEVFVNHGAPLPLAILDVGRALDPASLEAAACADLRALQRDDNARLVDAAELAAAPDFAGTPYAPDTPIAVGLFDSRRRLGPTWVERAPIDPAALFPRSPPKAKAKRARAGSRDPHAAGLELMAGAPLETFTGTYLPILAAVSQDVVDDPFVELDQPAGGNEVGFRLPLWSAGILQPVVVSPTDRATIQRTLGAAASPWTLDQSHGGDAVVDVWLSPSEVRRLRADAATKEIELAVDEDGDGMVLLGACDGTFRSALRWALGLSDDPIVDKVPNEGCSLEMKAAFDEVDPALAAHLSYFVDEDGIVALARRLEGGLPHAVATVARALDATLVVAFELQDPAFHVGVYQVRAGCLAEAWAQSAVIRRPIYFPVQPV
ncbi:MAG: hypothetical protein R3B06_02960 [Kofleriaceae bacterium]